MSEVITKPIKDYLQEVVLPLRLACTTQSGWPMVLSLWYLYEEGRLYCATQEAAKVVGYLQHEPRCAFEVAADQPPYCGVRAQATAQIVPQQGRAILERLLHRYLGGLDSDLAQGLLRRADSEVALVLHPRRFYRWNFSQRMPGQGGKLCPET